MNLEILRNFRPSIVTTVLVACAASFGVYLALGNSNASFSTITLIAVITGFFTWGLLLASTLIFFRTLSNKKYWLLILMVWLVLVGASRGWLMFELIEYLIPEFANSLAVRVLNSIFTVTIWGIIFGQVQGRLQAFREDYRRKFSKTVIDLATQSQASPAEIATSIDSLASIQVLQSNLREISDAAEGRQVSPSQLIAASQQIRNAIESSLRPLSHRIWFESSEAQPKFDLVELFRESLKRLSINWYPTSVIISVFFFIGALSLYELMPLVVRILVFGVTLALLLKVLEVRRDSLSGSEGKGVLVLLIVSLLSNTAGEVASSLIFFEVSFSNQPVLAVAGVISTAGILWVESVFSQLRTDWGRVNAAIEDSGTTANTAILQSRFAGYLHNNLQSQLSGIALALERVQPEDKKQIDELLLKLRTISSNSIGQNFLSLEPDPITRIEHIAESWKGIAEVRYTMPTELETEPKLELVAEFLQEAISNAVRHSGAKSIEIKVHSLESGLAVEVAHLSSNRKEGKGRLGQMWMERFSLNHSVVVDQDGTRRLTVIL